MQTDDYVLTHVRPVAHTEVCRLREDKGPDGKWSDTWVTEVDWRPVAAFRMQDRVGYTLGTLIADGGADVAIVDVGGAVYVDRLDEPLVHMDRWTTKPPSAVFTRDGDGQSRWAFGLRTLVGMDNDGLPEWQYA